MMIIFVCHIHRSLAGVFNASSEGTVSVINIEDFNEKDWSFLDSEELNSEQAKQNIERITSAGEISESSRVLVPNPAARLIEGDPKAEPPRTAPEQPSPVSVLDAAFYGDESLSPVKKTSKAFEANFRFLHICFFSQSTIRDAIEDNIMWPVRKIIPILPGDYRLELILKILSALGWWLKLWKSVMRSRRKCY
ncbi:hypothetical protein J1N35_044412, partial [Gossypium stocksii]